MLIREVETLRKSKTRNSTFNSISEKTLREILKENSFSTRCVLFRGCPVTKAMLCIVVGDVGEERKIVRLGKQVLVQIQTDLKRVNLRVFSSDTSRSGEEGNFRDQKMVK